MVAESSEDQGSLPDWVEARLIYGADPISHSWCHWGDTGGEVRLRGAFSLLVRDVVAYFLHWRRICSEWSKSPMKSRLISHFISGHGFVVSKLLRKDLCDGQLQILIQWHLSWQTITRGIWMDDLGWDDDSAIPLGDLAWLDVTRGITCVAFEAVRVWSVRT